MPDLTLSSATIRGIIAKARAFDARIEAASPARTAGSNGAGAADYFSDPTYQALTASLDRLSEDAGIEVLALAWLGRGDFAPAQWTEAVAQARQQGTRHLAEYLTTIPLLGDYLEAGLAAFVAPAEAAMAVGENDD